MEDRLVQYPNRVQLIQVDGQPGVYDIEAVPGTVTANGTPLNKATLLSDAVATLVNNAATPNEALKYLAERVQPIKLGGTGANTVEGILANLGIADYVVEQGTSGIWTYEKWNSGIAKLWGTYTGTSVTPTAWGNIYASDTIPRIDYPFAFTSAPQVQVTPRYTGTGGGFWIYCVGVGYTTQTPFYGAARGTNTAIVPCIDFYVIGRWK